MLHGIRRRVPTVSKTLGLLSRGKRAVSISLADRAAAALPAVSALRVNMEHEKKVKSAGNSARVARIAVRTLYAVPTRPPRDTAADTGLEPLWIEADPLGWDAPISVWWEHPPGADPR